MFAILENTEEITESSEIVIYNAWKSIHDNKKKFSWRECRISQNSRK